MLAAHDEARARAVERVWLEVIVENTQAAALYEALGYERVREVEVWSLDGGDGEADECDPDEAHAWIRARRTEPEPWQRADASLAKPGGDARAESRRRGCRRPARRGSGVGPAAARRP